MISTPKVIEAIIQSLPNKSGLDIYAQHIPDMIPSKITSSNTNQSFTPEMVVKSKDLMHVFSIEIKPAKTLSDSYLQKVKSFSLHAQKHDGKLYIVAKGNFIRQAKVQLADKYDNIDYLTIQ
jgi:hypothetical protein